MPLIAVARCSKLHDYEASVRKVGGEPWVLDPAADRPAEVVARAAGVLLTGGGDVDPSLYGEAPHPTFSAAEPGRDAYEIELVRRALEADLPVFAICRGMQLLNVARGGSLIQDIASQIPGGLKHKREEAAPPCTLAHEVWLDKGSLPQKLMSDSLSETESCQVNSRHHQAIRAAGDRLVTVATAPDGVIEAVEDPSRRFCLGVQWHPENFYRTGEFRALFEGFVTAATR